MNDMTGFQNFIKILFLGTLPKDHAFPQANSNLKNLSVFGTLT
jgi:hypothetical protein